MTSDPEAADIGPDPFAGPDWGTPGPAEPGAQPPVRRRRRVSLRRRRRRRRIGIALIVVGAAVLLTGAWLLVTGLMARSQLSAVRADVAKLRAQVSAGDLHAARTTARTLSSHAHRARQLTSGPAWAVAAALPGGGPFDTVRTLTTQVDAISEQALPPLINVSDRIDPSTLRRPDGSFDLARIAAARPALDLANRVLTDSVRAVGAAPAHTWLGAVDSARSSLLNQLAPLRGTVGSADLAAHVAPPMLGADGPRRYFVAFQNEAEARGTGGIPGAFAIIRADHGKISFERFESDSVLASVPVSLDFGTGYDQLFRGAETMRMYGNSNLSPNFPYAARIWLAMWHKHSGEQLDGAFAVDPTALSYLLAVTGPATMPDGTRISGDNVVAFSQSTIYARYPTLAQDAKRKLALLDLARAASNRVFATGTDTTALVRAAARATRERRLLAYSTDHAVESELAGSALGGVVPETSRPYVGLSIVNEAGNKLDYYLDRSLSWKRTGCGDTRDVTVTVKLTNNAPASGLSRTVDGRHDKHDYPVRPGDNRLDVSYYATTGAQLVGITRDGKPSTAGTGTDRGHPVFVADVEVPRGVTTTVVFHLREPAGHGSPLVLRQPLVRPLLVHLDDASCG